MTKAFRASDFFCRNFAKKCDETVNRVDSGQIFPTIIEIQTGAAKHRPRMGSGSAARAVLSEQVFSAIHALSVGSQKMQTFDIFLKSCKFEKFRGQIYVRIKN